MLRRVLLLLPLFVGLALAAGAGPAFAQCPMCRQAVENSIEGAAAASGINAAILILLIPPVAIFTGIFGVFYRYRNAFAERHGERGGGPASATPDSTRNVNGR